MDSPCKRRKDATGLKTQCNDRHEQEVDNSKALLQTIAHLYANQLMSDVCLVVGNRSYPTHRLMLCASSDVFRVMLMSPNFTESQEKHVILTEDPRCEPFFANLISYMYTGAITITYESVLPLLLLADKYNINDLTDLCLDYMEEHIVTAARNGCLVSWIQHTLQHHHSHQYRSFNQTSLNLICWNFDFVSETDDFHSLDPDVLVQLLQRNDLVIKDEFALFQSMSKWLLLQSDKMHHADESSGTERISTLVSEDSSIVYERGKDESHDKNSFLRNLVTQVMSHIRFPLMSYEDLANVFSDPIYACHSESIANQVLEAMKFHAIGHEAREAAFKRMRGEREADVTSFTPRLYTDDMWSSAIVVENFSEIPAYTTRTFVFETESTLFEKSVKKDRRSGHEANKRIRTREAAVAMQEWAVELFAKGVSFDKATLIRSSSPSFIVPDQKQDTVRITISSTRSSCPNTAFNVGVLINGRKNDVDFVSCVYSRRWFFDGDERVLRLDDILPFCDLNMPRPTPTPAKFKPHSQYLIGDDRNTLKVQIVITPICH